MPTSRTNRFDPEIIALDALSWIVSDPGRGERLLALTGLDGATLRNCAGDRATLAAVLGFLEAYEPDLVACATAIGVTPAALAGARVELDG